MPEDRSFSAGAAISEREMFAAIRRSRARIGVLVVSLLLIALCGVGLLVFGLDKVGFGLAAVGIGLVMVYLKRQWALGDRAAQA